VPIPLDRTQMPDQRDQPPLPFDPAPELVNSDEPPEPQREVSLDAFASLLLAELTRRSVAVSDREQRRA
jgi:hypothetical protein